MRPYSSGGRVSAMVSPTCAPGLARCASSSEIWFDEFSTCFDHQHVARQPQLALLGVDLGVNVGLAAVAGARRLGDGVFHRRDHDAAVDRFFARDRVCDLQQFEFIGADSCHGSVSFGGIDFAAGAVLPRRGGVPWYSSVTVLLVFNFGFGLLLLAGSLFFACGGGGGSSPRFWRSSRSAALPRRIDSAISSSVSTSLASAMSSITSRTSASSPARVSSR